MHLGGSVTWGKKKPHRVFTPFLPCLQATCDRSLSLADFYKSLVFLCKVEGST